MPTVFRFFGFRVMIYPNDHRPPHIHIIGAEHSAVFNLNCTQGPVEVRENYGFSLSELRSIARVLDENIQMLCQKWEEIHGNA